MVFRTAPGTKLFSGPRSAATFEIDAFDREHRTGWSVVVTGRLEEVTKFDAATLNRVRALPVVGGRRQAALDAADPLQNQRPADPALTDQPASHPVTTSIDAVGQRTALWCCPSVVVTSSEMGDRAGEATLGYRPRVTHGSAHHTRQVCQPLAADSQGRKSRSAAADGPDSSSAGSQPVVRRPSEHRIVVASSVGV